ncbi:MAG: hypothetical protein WC718_12165 [Phycisphaerales bacterium]
MMSLFDWYFDFPPLTRFLIALIPLAISTVLFFFARVLWPWGWVAGGIMLCCSLPTRGEKNKWGDW